LKQPFMRNDIAIGESHPVRVRGLKPFERLHIVTDMPSHPVRVRGLKRPPCIIERFGNDGRTPCGCVD